MSSLVYIAVIASLIGLCYSDVSCPICTNCTAVVFNNTNIDQICNGTTPFCQITCNTDFSNLMSIQATFSGRCTSSCTPASRNINGTISRTLCSRAASSSYPTITRLLLSLVVAFHLSAFCYTIN